MIPKDWRLRCSDRLYRVFLSFYPLEFRIRYGREMAQVFSDCCRDAIEDEKSGGLAIFWLCSLVDFATSVARERSRVWLEGSSVQSRTAGMVESLVILSIIGLHLVMGGGGIAIYLNNDATSRAFLILWALSSITLGGIGVICSMVLSRTRQVRCRLIGL
jgi:hypothetical protein